MINKCEFKGCHEPSTYYDHSHFWCSKHSFFAKAVTEEIEKLKQDFKKDKLNGTS